MVVFPVPFSPSRIVHLAGRPFPSERSSFCLSEKQRTYFQLKREEV